MKVQGDSLQMSKDSLHLWVPQMLVDLDSDSHGPSSAPKANKTKNTMKSHAQKKVENANVVKILRITLSSMVKKVTD